jgi:hypothetical protein
MPLMLHQMSLKMQGSPIVWCLHYGQERHLLRLYKRLGLSLCTHPDLCLLCEKEAGGSLLGEEDKRHTTHLKVTALGDSSVSPLGHTVPDL